MVPCARTRSRRGSHTMNVLVRFGKQPASPAPNSACIATSDPTFQTAPVNAVNADHQITIRSNTRRGPSQSPKYPPGISNNAYAPANAENAYPICTELRPKSFETNGAAKDIQTRSINVITASATAKTITQ